jgi:ribosome biogenesis protein MAK21
MGKKAKKGKSSSVPQTGSSKDTTVIQNSTKDSESPLSLDENTLASLRQKIEQRLASTNASTKISSKNKHITLTEAAKKKGLQQHVRDKQNINKGKKRNHNGEIIAGEQLEVTARRPPTLGKKDRDSDLRNEILALGGDDDDFELLAQVDPEGQEGDFVEVSAKSDGRINEDTLRRELSKMIQSAGHVEPIVYDDNDLEIEAENTHSVEVEEHNVTISSEPEVSQKDGASDEDEHDVKHSQNLTYVPAANEFSNLVS